MKRIAIQGQPGSFHDIAAHLYFAGEEIALACCATFEQVFDTLDQDPHAIGLVAIENTIAGSLLHNYDLLRASGAEVAGECKLHITHCLCCLPDDDPAALTEIHSHPVALMQCRHFLATKPGLKAVEAEDTAGAAAHIMAHKLHGQAAICHAEAARHYGMRVLEDHIEDNKHNFTRFLVVAKRNAAAVLREGKTLNKSSLVFSLPHTEGSLSKVLTILSFYDINLTKIQSLPIVGREWEYMFYVDVVFDSPTRYRQSIDAIAPLTRELKILGNYEDGKQYD